VSDVIACVGVSGVGGGGQLGGGCCLLAPNGAAGIGAVAAAGIASGNSECSELALALTLLAPLPSTIGKCKCT
jgi:hypothetical protein